MALLRSRARRPVLGGGGHAGDPAEQPRRCPPGEEPQGAAGEEGRAAPQVAGHGIDRRGRAAIGPVGAVAGRAPAAAAGRTAPSPDARGEGRGGRAPVREHPGPVAPAAGGRHRSAAVAIPGLHGDPPPGRARDRQPLLRGRGVCGEQPVGGRGRHGPRDRPDPPSPQHREHPQAPALRTHAGRGRDPARDAGARCAVPVRRVHARELRPRLPGCGPCQGGAGAVAQCARRVDAAPARCGPLLRLPEGNGDDDAAPPARHVRADAGARGRRGDAVGHHVDVREPGADRGWREDTGSRANRRATRERAGHGRAWVPFVRAC